jgi:hypothetical protein
MARRLSTYLLVLGEREAIWWVLTESRMAFQAHRAAQAARQLEPGVQLLLYVTRGAFHNPTRDRGQVIGEAIVASPLTSLDDALSMAGRKFTVACDLDIRAIAPRSEGVDLAALVDQLESFPVKHAWSARMRQPLVAFTDSDSQEVRRRLRGSTAGIDRDFAIESYRPQTGARATTV